ARWSNKQSSPDAQPMLVACSEHAQALPEQMLGDAKIKTQINIKSPPLRACARVATPAPEPDEPAPLGVRLGEVFRELRGAEYQPSHQDELALRALMRQANGDEDEIVRR